MSEDGGRRALATATARLLATIDRLEPDAVAQPSLLPDWTVGHVLTHLARNADGNVLMAEGAMRGEVVHQYPHGRAGRAADIEAGAHRPAPVIVADTRTAAERLAGVLDAMTPEAWARPVAVFAGEYPARQILVNRLREVEIHHVDLRAGFGPDDWPDDFVTAELIERVQTLTGRLAPGNVLALGDTTHGATWTVGDGAPTHPVRGPAAWLLSWLSGRTPAAGSLDAPNGLPELAPW